MKYSSQDSDSEEVIAHFTDVCDTVLTEFLTIVIERRLKR